MPDANEISGTIHEDTVIPAGKPWSGVVAKGDVLRIIDLEGCQAVDFICFNARDTTEAYDNSVTIRVPRSIYIRKGTTLYSSLSNPMMSLEEDTSGHHDTLCGCCSREINTVRYGKPGAWSCRDNFLGELAKHDLDCRSLVHNVNFFMDIPIAANGNLEIKAGPSKPGDYVDLRAEMDVLAVLSNCPQTLNAANGVAPTPIRIVRFSTTRE